MIDFDMFEKETLKIDGFDDAIIGYGEQYSKQPLLVYSYSKICEILRERDGMSWEEADEFAQFNIANAWVGDRTPMILYNEYWHEWKDEPEMWTHYCPVEETEMEIAKGEECNWCGATEDCDWKDNESSS